MKADFGVFGGDDRSRYLAAQLQKRGYRVIAYGLPGSRGQKTLMPVPGPFELAGTLAELVQNAKVLAGPVPFSKYVASGTGKNPDNNDEWTEGTLLGEIWEGQVLYAGGIPEDFVKKAGGLGVSCRDFFKDGRFLQANAWMTAEGCLAELLAVWPGCIRDARVFITGYGCCGSAIARLLKQVGARVTVCVRNIQSAWEAHEEGCKVCYYEGMAESLAGQEIIINTVPALVFDEAALKQAGPGSLFIEIASAPGGFPKEAVGKLGLNLLCYPGLPGRYSPAGAAKAMADCMAAYQGGQPLKRLLAQIS